MGLERIGKTIAKRAKAFGATISYHSRTKRDVPFTYFKQLSEMAAHVDVLICITPGGAATKHLVDRAVLDALGPKGLLINVSRGSVVDQNALIAALQAGHLGGAALDVFEDEPHIPDALKSLENVVLTPHIGSATVETRQAMVDLDSANLEKFLHNGRLLTPVPECSAWLE